MLTNHGNEYNFTSPVGKMSMRPCSLFPCYAFCYMCGIYFLSIIV